MKNAIKKLLPLAAVLLAAAMLGGCGAETDKPAGTSGIGRTSETKDTGTEKTTAPLRITCVGDSITFGECATTPDASYPSVMACILGDGYLVENCGKSGAAVINGETAILYTSTAEYRKSLGSTPDIVIMMLGTNDSCSKNDWTAEKEAGFKAKYIALIDTYAGLESRPKVILATCPKRTDAKAFDDCIRLKMVPLIKAVAEEKGLSVIDIYDATKDFTRDDYVDALHPNDGGYKKLAEAMAKGLNGILG